tara:strand:+ start:43893 stop:45167 length:1275 start_codon:yes stop_codon:yes gene_type:complete
MKSDNKFLSNNMDKIASIVIIIALIVSLSGVFLMNKNNTTEDIYTEENLYTHLLPDLIKNDNILKSVARDGKYPTIVKAAIEEKDVFVVQAPLYYYLISPLFLLSNKIGINHIVLIQIFNSILMLLTNVFFYLILKRVSRYFKLGNEFVLLSLLLFVFLPVHLYVTLVLGADISYYFFFVLSFYAFIKLSDKKTTSNALFLGVVLGFALLSRLFTVILIGTLILYAIRLHVKKRFHFRNKLLISLLVSIFGLTSIIRVLILSLRSKANNFIVDEVYAGAFIERSFSELPQLFGGFWGGVFGGSEQIRVLIIIVSILLTIITIFGMFKFFKINEKVGLSYLFLVSIITLVFGLHFSCNFLNLATSFTCVGELAHGRYFLVLDSLIALLVPAFILNIKDDALKLVGRGFIVIAAILFIVDFLYAFI